MFTAMPMAGTKYPADLKALDPFLRRLKTVRRAAQVPTRHRAPRADSRANGRSSGRPSSFSSSRGLPQGGKFASRSRSFDRGSSPASVLFLRLRRRQARTPGAGILCTAASGRLYSLVRREPSGFVAEVGGSVGGQGGAPSHVHRGLAAASAPVHREAGTPLRRRAAGRGR
jgi:hypothetical protein